jgi:uncharacterized protein (DUF488 family)
MAYPKIKNTCFTIGHSNHCINYFIEILKKNRINILIDVRSSPYSKYAYQFNKDNIKHYLNDEEINYLFAGNVLGGKYKDKNLLFPNGIPDYRKIMDTEKFNSGLLKVVSLIEKGNTVVIMCTEKNPLDCHRFNLISRGLEKLKVNILHIMEDGNLKTNNQIKNELMKKFMKSYYNLSLFDDPIDKKEALEKAYEFANKEIANQE